ncbi:hypothetical protein HWX41_27250 [Bacillus paramycoides]|uniref:hypothetical protein n=1 Tax=Bacillus paramycoides TaxID=2026194 RepID=UPI0015BA5C5C|nr:hypothetical protein [Bacillus paramycoides]NWK72621.1 hypothetical protein [Bacillus paramycoides]
MKFNEEQQEMFDIGVELYEGYESAELIGVVPFFAEARKQLYKSILALIISTEEEVISTRFESVGSYEELLATFPEGHPARTYYKGVQNLSPSAKASVTCDFKITLREFLSLMDEMHEKYKIDKKKTNR